MTTHHLHGAVISFVAASVLALPVPLSAQTAPVDHGGADWTIAENTTIFGAHTNVRSFVVQSGVTVKVKAYDGTDTASGKLEVHCENLIMEEGATLSAEASGYAGGSGGGGGAGVYDRPFPPAVLYGEPGLAGGVPYSASGLLGSSGFREIGGFGGIGDGPYGGQDTHGGYAADGQNGDTSTDLQVRMGSGGGGQRGANGSTSTSDYGVGGTGGSSGGRGGGAISLFVHGNVELSANSSITADGSRGVAGSNANDEDGGFGGYSGQGNRGNYGAGGGVIIYFPQAATVSISETASISSTALSSNGGTVKLFVPAFVYDEDIVAVTAGRKFMAKPASGAPDILLGKVAEFSMNLDDSNDDAIIDAGDCVRPLKP